MSGGGVAITIILFNLVFGMLWGITLYANAHDKFNSPDISKFTYSNLNDTNKKEDIINELKRTGQYNYNVGIFNSLIALYLTLSTVIAGWILLNPVK